MFPSFPETSSRMTSFFHVETDSGSRTYDRTYSIQYIYTPNIIPYLVYPLKWRFGVSQHLIMSFFFFLEQLVLAIIHFQQISNHQHKHVEEPLCVGSTCFSKVSSIHHTHQVSGESQLLLHHAFVTGSCFC